jgi:hypothetical protein
MIQAQGWGGKINRRSRKCSVEISAESSQRPEEKSLGMGRGWGLKGSLSHTEKNGPWAAHTAGQVLWPGQGGCEAALLQVLNPI